MSRPHWAWQFAEQEFSSGPTMGADGKAWVSESRKWLKAFLNDIDPEYKTLHFRVNHYEWYAHIQLSNDKWWYLSSGDVRFKVMKSLLVRTATGPKDFTGGMNQFVDYTKLDFNERLKEILCLGLS